MPQALKEAFIKGLPPLEPVKRYAHRGQNSHIQLSIFAFIASFIRASTRLSALVASPPTFYLYRAIRTRENLNYKRLYRFNNG
jgi:hypothetical protein